MCFSYWLVLKTVRVFLLFHYWFLIESEVGTDEKLLFKESFRLYIGNLKKNQPLDKLAYVSEGGVELEYNFSYILCM